MPDIKMCRGKGCPDKMMCYRHMAETDDPTQSYFIEIPYDHQEKICKDFWRLKLGDKIREESNEY